MKITDRTDKRVAAGGMMKTQSRSAQSLNKRARQERESSRGAGQADGGRSRDNPAVEGVTAIISQWERERPDLDFRPMSLFVALARSHNLASGQIDRLAANHGLTRGMFDVLATLRRSGPPYSLTPKQLSASLLLSGAGMTSRLDSLEKLQLVTRVPEPTDRRSLQIKMTRRGMSLVDKILPELLECQRGFFDFGESNSKQLLVQLKLMNEHLTRLLKAPRLK